MKHTSVFEQGDMQVLRYHSTNVMSVTDTTVILDSGGWQTATTKRRLEQGAEIFGLKLGVYQKDRKWWVRLADGSTIPFKDGMKIRREEVTA